MAPRRVDRLAWLEAIASAGGPKHAQTRHVLMVLALFLRKDGAGAWPSQETLATRSGLSVRSVRRCLDRAEREGWLYRIVDRRHGGQNWRVTRYVAVMPEGFSADEPRAQGPVRLSPPLDQGAASVSIPSVGKVRTKATEGADNGDKKVRSGCSTNPLTGKLSHRNPPSIPGEEQDSQEVDRKIEDLDLGAEAIAISQRARPGADPLAVLRAFRKWGQGKPAANWRRSLATFAIGERLSDDEIRAEQACLRNRCTPREPGESLTEFTGRVADPPIAPDAHQAIAHARTLLGGAP